MFFENLGFAQFYENSWNILSLFDLSLVKTKLVCLDSAGEAISCVLNGQGDDYIFRELRSSWKVCSELRKDVFKNERMLESLLAHHALLKVRRRKRALIDLGGIALKELFGTLNFDDAKYFYDKINNLKNNQVVLAELLKNQIKITEENLLFQNETFLQVNQNLENISRSLQIEIINNTRTIEKIKIYEILMSKISTYKFELYELQSVIEHLIQAITFSKLNVLHPLVISADLLFKEMLRCKILLKPGVEFPFLLDKDEIANILKYLSVSSLLYNDKIIFTISIPVVKVPKYDVYNLIPVPARLNDTFVFINPGSKYLLYSDEENYFTTLNSLSACANLRSKEYICKHETPLLNKFSNRNCEMDILLQKPTFVESCSIFKVNITSEKWMSLQAKDSWIFVVPQLSKLTIKCANRTNSISLVNVGIFKLKGNCRAFNDLVNLVSANVHSLNFSVVKIPLNIFEQRINLSTIPTYSTSSGPLFAPVSNLIADHNYRKIHEDLVSHRVKVDKLLDEERNGNENVLKLSSRVWKYLSLICLIFIVAVLIFLYLMIRRVYLTFVHLVKVDEVRSTVK